MAGKESLYDKVDKRARRWAATAGAIVALVGVAAGICSWVSNQFQTAVSNQISGFQQEVEDANMRQEQSVTRVELLMLMTHDPDNKVAIEKMARYYFHTLGGDLWMTQKYSDWCDAYDGDATIVIGVD